MLPESLDADFYEGRRSAGLPFCVNDSVAVVAGPYSGKLGAVVGLDRAGAVPRYLVEFGDGTDELLSPVQLRLEARAS